MSKFDDLLGASLAKFYAMWGDQAAYWDTDDTILNASLTVLVERDLTQFAEPVNIQGASALMQVRKTEVLDPPKRGQKFIVGAVTYEVDEVIRSDEHEHRFLVI